MPKSAERNKEIREQSKEMILNKSMLYFAQNGIGGTKIGGLAKYIGIGQGSLYAYFDSKEALYQEIQTVIGISIREDVKELKLLASLPIQAVKKVHKLTDTVLQRLRDDDKAAAIVVLSTQMMLEQNADYSSTDTVYQSGLYKYTAKMIAQGQKEGSAVMGNPMKLADYYWGVVYLYALKKLFTTEYEILDSKDLERTILKCRERES
ncbi:MAG TPA: TetR/AcrR family transcriptional regulator [Clostridiales bacterium]|nr:TetR/AcrR family transcriptional regulator [Clostridiales bacterium]